MASRKRSRDVDSSEISEAPQPVSKKVTGPSGNTQDLLTLFTDCMSALSTNKICSRNAFEVGIIDHMTDLVHLDDGSVDDDVVELLPEDTSSGASRRLNFTRASKVVESASKIYGYRIEAIYDQTFNVLMSMNSANQADGTSGSTSATKPRGRHRVKIDLTTSSRTLAPESEVTLTEIPMDNVILDPYFLKISSMFDHSGAMGLLLINLQVTDDLSLDLDGDSLVFPPPRARSEHDDSNVILSRDAVKKCFFGNTEPKRMEILPEAAYFRQELERLREMRRRKECGDVIASDSDGEINPEPESKHIDFFKVRQPIAPIEDSLEPMDAMGHIDDVPEDTVHDMPISGTPPDTGSDTGSVPNSTGIALRQRLAEIDLIGGSQFSYYTSVPVKTHVPSSKNKGSDTEPDDTNLKTQRPVKSRQNITNDLESYLRNIDLEEKIASVELSTVFTTPKAVGKKAPSTFAASDFTGAIYRFNDTFLTRLGLLGNRCLRFVSDHEWRNGPNTDSSVPILQVHYCADIDAPYSTMRISENFSWRLDEQVGLLDEDDMWNASNDFEDPELPLTQDGPVVANIESMYESEPGEPLLALSQHADPAAISQWPREGAIVPAPVAAYVDIFKIKKTLCGVIVPPPAFHEALEDKQQIDKEHGSGNTQSEYSCGFQDAVTDTVSRLMDSDVAALTSHILFVCLLHVCNEQDLLLKQSRPLEDFVICAGAPKEQHLGDVQGSL
ncbi:Condensin complex subunit 2 family protein [Babesia bovis T2Bo]|uniref:Condensin complex subunit 2 n=1 Tax=Babesia bovis TaxID=5865 RepID=A7AW72_BABBO|nr:Condensin complex subunit 2 family protein [Babesia bovis T2Bo]EDO05300.1 Condensin complex subunit 2 family protein [Babesia bovis T2Bo]|eukprot:XP_001608868.1 hypothetical protein [Babesia bovis T2Bo]